MKLKHLILLSITGTIITLDQVTKLLVLQKFHLGESVSVIKGFFDLTYIRNPGAAFGILARWESDFRIPFFILVPIIALIIIVYLFRRVDDSDVKLSVALSLVMGGAIGNLIDRAAYNFVVDFLDFYWRTGGPHFPAFNIADAAICIGVGLLILDIIQKENEERLNKKGSKQNVASFV